VPDTLCQLETAAFNKNPTKAEGIFRVVWAVVLLRLAMGHIHTTIVKKISPVVCYVFSRTKKILYKNLFLIFLRVLRDFSSKESKDKISIVFDKIDVLPISSYLTKKNKKYENYICLS